MDMFISNCYLGSTQSLLHSCSGEKVASGSQESVEEFLLLLDRSMGEHCNNCTHLHCSPNMTLSNTQ